MLRFNTFRARRYLRTRFVEGNFLLASEASDLELEILDLLRTSVQSMMGDVAIGEAWKVERLTDTSVLVKPGEAWFKGLPFINRFGKDQLVSGAIFTLGSIPVGVTATDHPDGLGKVISFNQVSTTPTNNYRFIVTALEELITDVDDPFLKNANLTESTGQKVRLNFQLNIVPVSSQTTSPVPYRDENSTSGGPITNYPDTGGTASPNYVNEIDLVPTAAGNGEQVSLTIVTGSEAIDGRDLELVLRNDPGLGGGNPLPNSPAEQQRFSNGKLIDSNGTEFHINAIFNDTISTQVVIRIDKEPGQPNPEIINTKSIKFIKRDVYTTDDVNGAPQGRVHWPIADVDWDSSSLLSHQSKITDLRTVVEDNKEFQEKTNIKDNIILAEGGDVSFDATSGLLTWSAAFQVLHPFGTASSITASSANMLDGASLVYSLDLVNGGAVEKGNQAINITTGGTVLTVDPITYDTLTLGNVVVDSAGTLTYITAIDPDSNQITVNDALVTGAGTIFQDQYASGQAPLTIDTFTLAARSGNRIYFYRGLLELEDGETSQVGDGVSSQLLAYMGATSESDSDPNYTSTAVVTQGSSLTQAISDLDGTVGANTWLTPVANFAALPAVGNTDGDVRLVLDTRVAYHWDDAQMLWLPLTGTGAGLKVVGGGTVSYGENLGTPVFTAENLTTTGGGAIASNANNWFSQSFTAGSSGNLTRAILRLNRSNTNPAGPVTAKLFSVSGGEPDTELATSTTTVDASTFGVAPAFTEVDFNFSGITLSAGTEYAVVVDLSGTTFGGNIGSELLNTGAYSPGTSHVSTGGSGGPWIDQSIDLYFQVEVQPSSIELTFTENMYLEKAGLTYEDNTIPVSESPIIIPSSGSSTTTVDFLSQATENFSLAMAPGALGYIPYAQDFLANAGMASGVTEIEMFLSRDGSPVADMIVTLRDESGGLPGSVIATSDPVPAASISATPGTQVFNFSTPVALTPGTTYFLVIEVNNITTFDASNHIDVHLNNTNVYPDGAAYRDLTGGSFVFTDPPNGNNDLYFIIRGETTSANVNNNVAYVEPNLIGGGPNLTVVVDTLDNVPPTGIIIARRDGDDVIVGSSSTRLALGESSKLYDTITDQARDKQRGADYGFFRSDNPVTWTGTELQFTSSITLETITRDGTEQEAIISQASSPLVIPDGQWAWIEMDRNIQSQNVSFQTGATPPAIPEAGKDVFVFGKRRDQGVGNGYLHLALHKQVLEPGQTVRLGASGAGGSGGASFEETLKNRLNDSPFEAVFPYVAETDTDDATSIDPTSTGSYDLLVKRFRLGAGEFLLSANVLDSEFTTNFTDVYGAELIVKWDNDGIDTAATYELSKDGGTTWETVTMEQVADTGTFRGILIFDDSITGLDLRARITASAADSLVEGFGVLFEHITAEQVSASTTEIRFNTSFNAVADNFTTFTLPFRPTEGLQVFLKGSGQVFTYGDFSLSGNDVVFSADQFNNGGVEKVQTLSFVEPIDARFFDNSDLNRGLLVANHLGSTDGSNDASVVGRGIFLRRPDGTLREIAIDDNDNIVIYSV